MKSRFIKSLFTRSVGGGVGVHIAIASGTFILKTTLRSLGPTENSVFKADLVDNFTSDLKQIHVYRQFLMKKVASAQDRIFSNRIQRRQGNAT